MCLIMFLKKCHLFSFRKILHKILWVEKRWTEKKYQKKRECVNCKLCHTILGVFVLFCSLSSLYSYLSLYLSFFECFLSSFSALSLSLSLCQLNSYFFSLLLSLSLKSINKPFHLIWFPIIQISHLLISHFNFNLIEHFCRSSSLPILNIDLKFKHTKKTHKNSKILSIFWLLLLICLFLWFCY